jgi:hypothetical protein
MIMLFVTVASAIDVRMQLQTLTLSKRGSKQHTQQQQQSAMTTEMIVCTMCCEPFRR